MVSIRNGALGLTFIWLQYCNLAMVAIKKLCVGDVSKNIVTSFSDMDAIVAIKNRELGLIFVM